MDLKLFFDVLHATVDVILLVALLRIVQALSKKP